jgi:hypothetical protein
LFFIVVVYSFFSFSLLFSFFSGASSPAYSSSGFLLATNGHQIRVSIGTGFTDAAFNCTSIITSNAFHHVVVTRSSGLVTVYLDGSVEVNKNRIKTEAKRK